MEPQPSELMDQNFWNSLSFFIKSSENLQVFQKINKTCQDNYCDCDMCIK